MEFQKKLFENFETFFDFVPSTIPSSFPLYLYIPDLEMACNPSTSSKGKGGCDDCTCANQNESFPIKINTQSTSNESTPLLWKTSPPSDQSTSVPQDAPKKCDILVHPGANSRRTVCCRELKKDERALIDPDIIRDCIIGLSDGLTVSTHSRDNILVHSGSDLR